MLTRCQCSCWPCWHCVSVVVDYAATCFSQISSQKRKYSRNRFCLFIWGPGGVFFYKISLENIVTLSFLNSSSLSNTVLYCHATATQWMQWTILGSCVVQTSVEWRVLLSRLHLFPKIRLQPFPKRGCTRYLCRGCIHALSRGCTCSLRRGCTRSLSRGYTHSLSRAAPIP